MARPRLVGLILALFTMLVFLPAAHYGFLLFDDPEYLTENRIVQAGLTWSGLKWAFATWYASNWHPLTWLSHMLDCQVFGLDAGAHHMVSVGIHAANSVLLLFLLVRLTDSLWPSALVAAFFAWHPLRLESVVWAAERKDVLCAFFWMLTLWAYVRYVETFNSQSVGGEAKANRGSPCAPHHPSFFYSLALVFYMLGLLSKPMIVTLPFVLLLLDYWPLKRLRTSRSQNGHSRALWTKAVVEKVPFFLLAAASCLVTVLAQQSEAIVALTPYPLSLRCANAILSYVRYLSKTLWPLNLAIVYPLPKHLELVMVVLAGCLLAGLSWLAWRTRKERPHLFVGWSWFVGTLVPVIGLVQVGGQSMADRYTYLPSIGLFLALVFEGCYWVERWRVPSAATASIAALLLAGCLAGTGVQLRYWKDSETLFVHAVAVTGENAIARINLGVALEKQRKLSDALAQYKEAVRINPDLAQGHNNLANLLDATGNPEEALSQYREAVRLKPRAELPRLNLAAQLLELGKFDEAMSEYKIAETLKPEDPRPHYRMGKAWLKHGQSSQAIMQFRQALTLDPINPQVLVNLARVLGADQNSLNRNGADAVRFAEKANRLTGGQDTFVLDTLGIAYSDAGRFKEAQQAARAALELAGKDDDKKTVSAIEARLRLYEAGQPYHEDFTKSQP